MRSVKESKAICCRQEDKLTQVWSNTRVPVSIVPLCSAKCIETRIPLGFVVFSEQLGPHCLLLRQRAFKSHSRALSKSRNTFLHVSGSTKHHVNGGFQGQQDRQTYIHIHTHHRMSKGQKSSEKSQHTPRWWSLFFLCFRCSWGAPRTVSCSEEMWSCP